MSTAPPVAAWTSALAATWIRAPHADDDKYTRGVLGVRTGSPQYPGAAVLGVEAAWRTGVGMVRYVGPDALSGRVLDGRPETVLGGGRVHAWLVGSGMDASTRADTETEALFDILQGDAPVVVDAGALDLVVPRPGIPAVTAPLVLTPHSREFARLERSAGLPPRALGDESARTAAARALAAQLGHTVLLKGATTIVAAPDGWCVTVRAATPWLATAGTGDVLGGVLGALAAGRAADGALTAGDLAAIAATAALVHGLAGRMAAGLAPCKQAGGKEPGRPITALDVAHALPEAVASVLSGPPLPPLQAHPPSVPPELATPPGH